MKQKYIQTFVGAYGVSENNPTRYVNTHTGVELIVKSRKKPTPTQTSHYLVSKTPTETTFTYLSGLWQVPGGKPIYRVSDYVSQGKRNIGYAVMDLFTITITTTAP
jgi:hypothetical protein